MPVITIIFPLVMSFLIVACEKKIFTIKVDHSSCFGHLFGYGAKGNICTFRLVRLKKVPDFGGMAYILYGWSLGVSDNILFQL